MAAHVFSGSHSTRAFRYTHGVVSLSGLDIGGRLVGVYLAYEGAKNKQNEAIRRLIVAVIIASLRGVGGNGPSV